MSMPLEERYAMGECARRRVIEDFGMESVLNRWERLYEALLDRKSVKWRMRLPVREISSRHSAASA
jgi:hypothetical protein